MTQGNYDLIAWSALLVVLIALATGYRRFELVAACALLSLGALGVAPVTVVLAGFGHPALATIVALYVVGQGISESGMLSGLGVALERRFTSHRAQVLGLGLVTASLSAFMSNVGAVAAVLPTAIRMAARAGVAAGRYGLPISMAAIIGGTLTLAGSAPTIIVSGYRTLAVGEPFRMFDYFPHGFAILLAGVLLWLLLGRRLVGRAFQPGPGPGEIQAPPAEVRHDEPAPHFAPFATPKRRRCLVIFLAAVFATTTGIAAPAVGFGLAAILMIFAGVLEPAQAYSAIDLRTVLFLGSMLGIGGVLEKIGALARMIAQISPVAVALPRLGLLAVVFALSCLLGNVLNNAAAAAVMAPLAIELAAVGVAASRDALLMAVAAGSCLAIVLPTHQAILLGMSRTGFSVRELRSAGLRVVVLGGVLAVLVIALVWS